MLTPTFQYLQPIADERLQLLTSKFSQWCVINIFFVFYLHYFYFTFIKNYEVIVFIILVSYVAFLGYVHQLLPVKISANKNAYFDLKFQTQDQGLRAVCFCPEKHGHDKFKRKRESSSPLKISKF